MLNTAEENLLVSLKSQRRIEGARYGAQLAAIKNPGLQAVAEVTLAVCQEIDKQIRELLDKQKEK